MRIDRERPLREEILRMEVKTGSSTAVMPSAYGRRSPAAAEINLVVKIHLLRIGLPKLEDE
jgi:hypothetical protein